MSDEMAAKPSFSFLYDGKDSRQFLADWNKTRKQTKGGNDTTVTVTRRDDVTGLEVELEEQRFSDSPAVEWVMRFRNSGKKDTPLIKNTVVKDNKPRHRPRRIGVR